MYERFTDRARKVMRLADQQARRFGHEYIGTEHVLLGLVEEGQGIGAVVLKNLDVDLRKIRVEVEKLMRSGADPVLGDDLPLTPRARYVVEYSAEEARSLNHNYVGAEHLLLGLLREQESVAARLLMNQGLTLDTVREEIIAALFHAPERSKGRPHANENSPPMIEIAQSEKDSEAQACSKNVVQARRESIRRFSTGILLGVCTLLFIFAGGIDLVLGLFVVPFAFDAPGSERNPALWIMVASILTFPAACGASIVLSWKCFRERLHLRACIWALSPLACVLMFWLAYSYVELFCGGRFDG